MAPAPWAVAVLTGLDAARVAWTPRDVETVARLTGEQAMAGVEWRARERIVEEAVEAVLAVGSWAPAVLTEVPTCL